MVAGFLIIDNKTMTTPQIIIFSILFIGDFYASIIIPIYKKNDPASAVFNTLRMCCVWILLLSVTITMNDLKEKVKGKCPDYEQVTEPVYRLKTP